MNDALIQEFWNNVVKTENCWSWTGSKHHNGAGRFRKHPGSEIAHHVAWILSGHTVEMGDHLIQTCENKLCVNPSHMTTAYTTEGIIFRFWKNVLKTETCWLWTGSKIGDGYGMMYISKEEKELTHRISWELHYGSKPGSLFVCHDCDTPICVRGSHLFLGTIQDNHADMVKKGRHPKAESHGGSKLTIEQVGFIRTAYATGSFTLKSLGDQFGVTEQCIWQIVHHKHWIGSDNSANACALESTP